MRKLLIVLAIILTLMLNLSYIFGALNPHGNLVYLGTVHYAMDYFYYLSEFIQGKMHWFSAIDLYTSDFKGATLVGATNVFTGHLLSYITGNPIIQYEIALAGYTFLLLLLSVFFLVRLFPNKSHGPLIAFILFTIANLAPGTGSFYANVAEPFIRFSRVPHQMLGDACILASMLIVLYWSDKDRKLGTKIILCILAAFSGGALANINPIQWLLTVCVLFFAIIVYCVTVYGLRITNYEKKLFIIPTIFFVSGLPMTIYLSHIFKSLPFSQSAVWESWQFIRLTPLHALASFGPVAGLAVVGIPLFLKKRTLPRLLLATYTIASIALFFSPIASWGKITNARFLSAITVLGEGAIVADFLLSIPIRNRIIRFLTVWGIVVVLMAILVPLGIQQFMYQHNNLDTNNAYVYISPLAAQAFNEAQKRMTERDVMLATWPYDSSFPALTGKRGFMGHMHLTIDPDKKNVEAYHFFAALEDDAAMQKFLTDNGITYVLEFTNVITMHKPFLQIIYQNPLLTLYKVAPL